MFMQTPPPPATPSSMKETQLKSTQSLRAAKAYLPNYTRQSYPAFPVCRIHCTDVRHMPQSFPLHLIHRTLKQPRWDRQALISCFDLYLHYSYTNVRWGEDAAGFSAFIYAISIAVAAQKEYIYIPLKPPLAVSG